MRGDLLGHRAATPAIARLPEVARRGVERRLEPLAQFDLPLAKSPDRTLAMLNLYWVAQQREVRPRGPEVVGVAVRRRAPPLGNGVEPAQLAQQQLSLEV